VVPKTFEELTTPYILNKLNLQPLRGSRVFQEKQMGKWEKRLNQYKPAVDRHVLLLLAGGMWMAVGVMLLTLSCIWLQSCPGKEAYLFAGIGITAAFIISRFGFQKIVDKNVRRILPMEGRRCAFAFMSWKSYLLVILMVATGITLRHSPVPKPYLSVLYTGIGLALILGSLRYWKAFIKETLKNA